MARHTKRPVAVSAVSGAEEARPERIRSAPGASRTSKTVASLIVASALGAGAVVSGSGPIGGTNAERSLAGTWTLAAAEKQLPDGSIVSDYGDAPRGRLMIDPEGRYSIQIFRSDRPQFASGEKSSATESELRAAVVGASTHYGLLQVDWAAARLTFTIEDSSFPNWRRAVQVRSFDFADEVLTYRLPPRADGSVPITIWRRERG